MKDRLSALWLFAVLNYLYCDLVGLMDPRLLRQYVSGEVSGIHFSQGFLLGASVLMEIPIAMILVSRRAPHPANRRANLAAASVMTAVQAASLLASIPTAYYVFFSAVEIGCTAAIVRHAWAWHEA